jgi:hypothetical protein
MSTHELNAGDRVHVTVRILILGYQPGDKGTVLRTGSQPSIGGRYYLVAVDKDGPDATGVLFGDDEIEADV